jgi:hypothetical protein
VSGLRLGFILAITNLAVSDQTKSATNAESWAQAAMAIYLQKTFQLSDPPLPESYRSGTASTSDGADLGSSRPRPTDGTPRAQHEPDLQSRHDQRDYDGVHRVSDGGRCRVSPTLQLQSKAPQHPRVSISHRHPTGRAPTDSGRTWNRCLNFCFDGTCMQSANASVVCSGCVVKPPTPVCIPGSYSDLDSAGRRARTACVSRTLGKPAFSVKSVRRSLCKASTVYEK